MCDSRAVAEHDEPVPHVEHYGNGMVKLEGFHRGGEMDGAWAFYRTDGSLMRSGSFDRGRQIGVWRTFDRSGELVKETDFGDGARRSAASTSPPAAAASRRRLAAMSDFSSRLDDFLTEFFRLNPTFATAIGEHAHDDRWPDLTDAGPSGTCRVHGPLARRFRGDDRPVPRRGASTATCSSASSRPPGSPTRSCARMPGTRSTGST